MSHDNHYCGAFTFLGSYKSAYTHHIVNEVRVVAVICHCSARSSPSFFLVRLMHVSEVHVASHVWPGLADGSRQRARRFLLSDELIPGFLSDPTGTFAEDERVGYGVLI